MLRLFGIRVLAVARQTSPQSPVHKKYLKYSESTSQPVECYLRRNCSSSIHFGYLCSSILGEWMKMALKSQHSRSIKFIIFNVRWKFICFPRAEVRKLITLKTPRSFLKAPLSPHEWLDLITLHIWRNDVASKSTSIKKTLPFKTISSSPPTTDTYGKFPDNCQTNSGVNESW